MPYVILRPLDRSGATVLHRLEQLTDPTRCTGAAGELVDRLLACVPA